MTNRGTRQKRPEIVAITGASAGLGRAITQEFARHGAKIGLIARGQQRLESTGHEVVALGGEAIAVSADVANYREVENAAAQIEAAFGPIDTWINNAMTTVFSEIDQIAPEEFKRATEVTYLGTVWGTMAALKRMLPRDAGTIVQVGSALAYRSIPLQAPYCGAKHAIAGFTDSLRTELVHKKSHVRVSMVQMPALNTPQFDWCRVRMPRRPQPVPPIFDPEQPAAAVYWAAHHHPRELYVGLPTVAAIIGNKFVPGLLDIFLGKTGYNSQQTDESNSDNRPDNLFHPLPGDFGSHGHFDRRAFQRPRPRSFRPVTLMLALGALMFASSRLIPPST